MPDEKSVVAKINALKSKINADLIELTKHFEKLGQIMKSKPNSPAYLRCRGHMRAASAMIRGVRNLKTNLIVPEEIEEEVVEETTSEEQKVVYG